MQEPFLPHWIKGKQNEYVKRSMWKKKQFCKNYYCWSFQLCLKLGSTGKKLSRYKLLSQYLGIDELAKIVQLNYGMMPLCGYQKTFLGENKYLFLTQLWEES